jgi:hypothetical protein
VIIFSYFACGGFSQPGPFLSRDYSPPSARHKFGIDAAHFIEH